MNIQLLCVALAMSVGAAQAAPALSGIPYPVETSGANTAPAISADGFSMTAAHGTDLFLNGDGSESADNTPRMLFRPLGDFILSVKVAAQFKREFDGAALIIYADGKHWAKLLYEQPRSGAPGISSTVAKGVGDDAHHGGAPGDAAYLKLARLKNLYVFYTSADGVTWRMVRNFHLPAAAPAGIGFSVQSPVGAAFTAKFSEVKFRAASFKDFWQGE